MKALALESMVKFIIFMAAASILLSLIVFFSGNIKGFIKGEMGRKEVKTEVIERGSFSSSQLATYITSCWDKTGERYKKNVICYVLKGDMSSVDINTVKAMVKAPKVDFTDFNNTKGIALIEFKELGNVIVVRS